MKRNPVRQGNASPNDTRYPATAVLLGVIVAVLAGGVVVIAARGEASVLVTVGLALAGLVLATLVLMAVKQADQWEKAVVLRFGTYRGLRGAGLFFILPVIDRIAYHVDQRIRATDFSAESCLTIHSMRPGIRPFAPPRSAGPTC